MNGTERKELEFWNPTHLGCDTFTSPSCALSTGHVKLRSCYRSVSSWSAAWAIKLSRAHAGGVRAVLTRTPPKLRPRQRKRPAIPKGLPDTHGGLSWLTCQGLLNVVVCEAIKKKNKKKLLWYLLTLFRILIKDFKYSSLPTWELGFWWESPQYPHKCQALFSS